jgi:hypothetical protein
LFIGWSAFEDAQHFAAGLERVDGLGTIVYFTLCLKE